jgi:hypothetical protein
MDQIKSNKRERVLATHVLQFVFLGFTGFRFPFAHFPSTTASATDMYLLISPKFLCRRTALYILLEPLNGYKQLYQCR